MKRSLYLLLPLSALLLLCNVSCESVVSAAGHARLSKPNMLFDEGLIFADESVIISAVEPGSGDASGAGGTGCAACR